MTDSLALEAAIKQSGLKKAAILEALGFKNYRTLARKIRNRVEFKASEIAILSDLLRLDPEERDRIFFIHESEKNATKKRRK